MIITNKNMDKCTIQLFMREEKIPESLFVCMFRRIINQFVQNITRFISDRETTMFFTDPYRKYLLRDIALNSCIELE